MISYRIPILITSFVLFSAGLARASETPDIRWNRIPAPQESLDSIWRVQDYIEDANVHYQHFFDIDFESNGTAWIASSRGLYRFEGYRWRHFVEMDGLPSSIVRCVFVTRNNELWVGSDRGAGEFDGSEYKTYASEVHLAGPSVRRIHQDEDGTLWFCCDPWPDENVSGGLSSFGAQGWKTYHVQDGLPSDRVLNYFQDSRGRRFVLTAEGLAVLHEDRWQKISIPGHEGPLWDMAEFPDGRLMVTANDAVYIRDEEEWTRYPNRLLQSARICSTQDGSIVSANDLDGDYRAFMEWSDGAFQRMSAAYRRRPGGIECMKEAPDGSIWCTGFNAATRWCRIQHSWAEYRDLPIPRLTDSEHRVWFSGDRTIVKDGHDWHEVEGFPQNTIQDSDGTVWGWSDNRIVHSLRNSSDFEIFSSGEKTGLATIEGLVPDRSMQIWAHGTDPEGKTVVLCRDGDSWADCTPDDLRQAKVLATKPDPAEGIWCVADRVNDRGRRFYWIRKDDSIHVPFDPSVPESTSFDFYIEPDHDLWLFGPFGALVSVVTNEERRGKWDPFTGLSNRHIFTIVRRGTEEWFGLLGDEMERDNLGHHDRTTDRWSILGVDVQDFGFLGEDDRIYFGGDGCINIIPDGDTLTHRRLTFPPGLDNVSDVVPGREGVLWLNSDAGVICYRPDNVPPDTQIIKAEQEILEGETLRVSFDAVEQFVPRDRNREYVYSWQLNEGNWNEFQRVPSAGLPVAGLRPGRYFLYVRAQDEGQDIDPSPAVCSFRVHPLSVRETWWFKSAVISVLFLLLILFVYALITRWKLAKYATNLESMVDQRTQALQESESRLRQIIDLVPHWIYARNRDGKFILSNKALARSFGKTVSDLDGKPYDILLSSTQEQERMEAQDRQVIDTRKPLFIAEETITLPNGQSRVFQVSRIPFEVSGTQETAVLAVAIDITERRELEEQLRQSHKMEAVGQLAGGIAHNVNNLLTGIMGNLGLIEQDIPPESRRFVADALNATDRSAQLVQQLLAFSRKSTIQLSRIDPNEVVEEVVRLTRQTVDRRIEIRTELEPDLPAVNADRAQLSSVLMNLCVNARDAIERILRGDQFPERLQEQFAVTVVTETCDLDEQFCETRPYARPGPFVVLTVADNGMGMPDEIRMRAFEPFFTTKQPGEGTGLGLASAYGAIRQHRGWIDFTSEYGKGSTFKIYLPALEKQERQEEPKEDSPQIPAGKETVLVIDDEELILDLANTLFQRNGYTVLTATDGDSGVQSFLENHKAIDLVLLDLSLPRRSGQEVLREIRAVAPDTKVIVSSGYAEEMQKDALDRLGAAAYLSKPYRPAHLLQTVRRILDGRSD